MAATALVEEEMQLGKEATEALDNAGLKPQATFWLYYPDAEEWRFVVSTPRVQRVGPLAFYAEIYDALGPLLKRLPFRRVTAMSPTREPVRALRKYLKTGPGISGVRLTQNVINRIYIEDAYIYRMN